MDVSKKHSIMTEKRVQQCSWLLNLSGPAVSNPVCHTENKIFVKCLVKPTKFKIKKEQQDLVVPDYNTNKRTSKNKICNKMKQL
jgi:hypothetical protein